MPTPETQGMMDIINKLNEAANQEPTAHQKLKSQRNTPTPNVIAGVSKDAQGMLEILQKLDEATHKATEEVIQESHNDITLSAVTKKGNSVTVGDYEVVLEKATLIPGMTKTFYNIKEGDEIIYNQIALFETAMGIVKGLLFEKDSKVERLLDLDNRYSSALAEAATFKMKAKTLTESSKIDIAMAKQGSALQKMKSIKNQIKSSL
jgi:hypothetical protein